MEAWRQTVDKAENFHLSVSVHPQALEHPSIHCLQKPRLWDRRFRCKINFTKKNEIQERVPSQCQILIQTVTAYIVGESCRGVCRQLGRFNRAGGMQIAETFEFQAAHTFIPSFFSSPSSHSSSAHGSQGVRTDRTALYMIITPPDFHDLMSRGLLKGRNPHRQSSGQI